MLQARCAGERRHARRVKKVSVNYDEKGNKSEGEEEEEGK